MKWKIGGKGIGFRREREEKSGKNEEPRPRFLSYREEIRGRILSGRPRILHGSDQPQQKHRRALGFIWVGKDPSSDLWIRGRICLGF